MGFFICWTLGGGTPCLLQGPGLITRMINHPLTNSLHLTHHPKHIPIHQSNSTYVKLIHELLKQLTIPTKIYHPHSTQVASSNCTDRLCKVGICIARPSNILHCTNLDAYTNKEQRNQNTKTPHRPQNPLYTNWPI